jgi:cytochrome c-type biogenesis protein CcsB
MGALSNQLLVVTILSYLAAMLCYAAEYAFGERGGVARVAGRELVGAGGGPVSLSESVDEQVRDAVRIREAQGEAPAKGGWWGGSRGVHHVGVAAVVLTGVGLLAHAATLLTRGLAAGRVPWGNMYEYVITATLVGLVAWLVLLARRPMVRPLGLYVTLVEVLLLGVAGMSLYTPAGPLVPALNSYWLKIHVSAAATATGIFLFGFLAATLFLIRAGYDAGKRRFPYEIGARLPAADSLERLAFRVHAFAFPIWTLAIICGAIWAEAAWGRFWGWDAKEVWSFVTWTAYAAFLHARATPSVRRTTAAWLAVFGWATMLFNLVGVNLFVSGLHSYAGV